MIALLLLLAGPAHATNRAVMEMIAASNNTIMITTPTARVGISTSLPATTLDVAGNAQFGNGATKSTFTTTGDLNMASNADLTLTGPTAYATFPASVTASAFFGNGSNLVGIPSSGSIVGMYLLKTGDSMTGPLTLVAGSSLTIQGGGGVGVTYGVSAATGVFTTSMTVPAANIATIISSLTVSGALGLSVTYGAALSTVTASTVVITQNGTSVLPLPNVPINIAGNINSALQMALQNQSNGAGASGDLIVGNDLSGNASFYLDVGINSSKFSDINMSAQASSSAYVFSSDSDLHIWAGINGALNTSRAPKLIFGSSNPVSNNRAFYIDTAVGSVQNPGAIVAYSSFTVLSSSGITAASSVTANAFFGDGSHLTGLSGLISGLTTGFIPKATNATTIGNGSFYEAGSSVTASNQVLFNSSVTFTMPPIGPIIRSTGSVFAANSTALTGATLVTCIAQSTVSFVVSLSTPAKHICAYVNATCDNSSTDVPSVFAVLMDGARIGPGTSTTIGDWPPAASSNFSVANFSCAAGRYRSINSVSTGTHNFCLTYAVYSGTTLHFCSNTASTSGLNYCSWQVEECD